MNRHYGFIEIKIREKIVYVLSIIKSTIFNKIKLFLTTFARKLKLIISEFF